MLERMEYLLICGLELLLAWSSYKIEPYHFITAILWCSWTFNFV